MREVETNLHGQVADYIPELAIADKHQGSVTLCSAGGSVLSAGSSAHRFTIHEISRVAALLYALEGLGQAYVFGRVGQEPTGRPLHESTFIGPFDGTRPSNPLIDAGAILVTSLFPGHDSKSKLSGFLQFFGRLCGNSDLDVDEKICQSESRVGHRFRATAWQMCHNGILCPQQTSAMELVESTLEVFFYQHSVLVTTVDLARFSAVLALGGINPASGVRLLREENVNAVIYLMQSCGLHNASGSFLLRVGIPVTSGVSGGLVGVVPGRAGVATYGAIVDQNGISTLGQSMLERLAQAEGFGLLKSSKIISERSTYSCFVSYSHEDEEFVSLLHTRLRDAGIRTWCAAKHMMPGQKIKAQIDKAIRTHDKLLLILSEHSVQSSWVATEIIESKAKEAATGRQVLFPIRLIHFEHLRDWSHFDSDLGADIAKEIREYYIPDFSGWNDPIKFDRAFEALVSSLQKEED